MNLIGIQKYKFSRAKWILLLIYKKGQCSLKDRKDLNRTVPMLLPHIVSVFPLKLKQLEWKSFVWNNQFVFKAHIALLLLFTKRKRIPCRRIKSALFVS